MKKHFILSFFVLFVLVLAGCRVKYSLSGASVGSAKTITVDYFSNMAELVYPPLSQDLTNAIKERFVSDTDLALVKQDGDLTFVGEIVEYKNEPVSVTADENAGAFRLTITVHVKYTNKKDKEFEFDKKFSRFRNYSGNNFSAVEANLSKEIVTELVDDIFKESVVNW